MRLLTNLLLTIALSSQALAQVTCTPMGPSTYCSGPNGTSRTYTELRPGQGIITDSDGHLEPYATIPSPPRSSGIQPLAPLPTMRAPTTSSGLGMSPLMPGLDPLVPSIMMLGE